MDYDSCKRELETLQTKMLRSKDSKDPKLILRLTTLESDFHDAKEQYDRITDELYEDLTMLNNNRAIFSAKILEYFYQVSIYYQNSHIILFKRSSLIVSLIYIFAVYTPYQCIITLWFS